VQGAQGTQGANGAAGSNGAQGHQGYIGTSGSVGTQGFQGSTGNSGSDSAPVTYETIGDSSVSLLLHMEGANNSTTFTDNSYSPKAATVTGNAKISTSTAKFGSSSAYFDGNGDFLSYAYSSDFDLSGGTYTIEGWVNPSSLASEMGVICKHGFGIGADWMFYITNSTTVKFYTNGTAYTRTVPTISTGTWYHFAVVRSAATGLISIYWNGTLAGATISATTTNTAATLGIGADRPNNPQVYFNGYIDEVRITKGTARYTSNFTPSASAFSNANEYGSLPAIASVGQTVYSSAGIYVCSSASPLVWKKYAVSPSTITL
jgi:hypothetical protein